MEIKIKQEGTRVWVPIGIANPNLGNRVTLINFLADTGADITTIGSDDALKIQIDFSKLKKNEMSTNRCWRCTILCI